MLRPFILIGVGGSGGKTLRAVRYALDLRLRAAGWTEGMPSAWQFLHIDTPIAQDDPGFPAPYLPHDSYLGLVSTGSTYSNVVNNINSKLSSKSKESANRQFPDPSKVPTNVMTGAGQYRAIGRTVALARLNAIASAAQTSYNNLRKPDSLSQLERLTRVLQGDTKQGTISDPVFIVVSSIAGGSGAGQYLDVVDAIKARFDGHAWALESFGILYAPDVFDGIRGTAGISRNSLATVSETINGYWNNQPSQTTNDIYQAAGLQLASGGALDRSGVRYPFVVGRQGQHAVFNGQYDIYLAISTTIAAWMTDDKFQTNIAAYTQGNWDANALPVLDETPFRAGDSRTPVTSAIGFGRVTLAREKFIEYSSERFARACIDRMLKAHTESDPNFEIMDEEAHVKDQAEKNLIAFLHASHLNEFNDDQGDNDDVITALRPGPELAAIATELRAEVAAQASLGLDKNGGLDVDTWHSRLMQLREQLIRDAMRRDRDIRQEKVEKWAATIQEHLAQVSGQFISNLGLRVTAELLDRLGGLLSQATKQLRGESISYSEYVGHLSSYVYEELRSAGHNDSLRPDSDPVQMALTRIEDSVSWESEAALRQTSANLLDEFTKEFLIPLKRFVVSSHEALSKSVSADHRADGRDNDYAFWPERNSQSVPKKYSPSSNEKMLLDPGEFSAQFEELVCKTVGNDRFMDAILTVMTEQLVEFEGHQLISVQQTWTPVTSADPTQVGVSGKRPHFGMSNQVEDYLERATDWMSRRGTSFYGFITQNLKDYLDPTLPPDVYKKREERFVGHIQSAFKAASPLVLVNPELLQEVHKLAPQTDDGIIISSIPFDKTHPVYDRLHSFFTQQMSSIPTIDGSKPDAAKEVDKLFRDQNVDSIEFFAIQGKPVQPFVMSSIMQPIATAWQADKTKAKKRDSFWKWSRGRLLAESIPMDREAYEAMLRGWYSALLAGMIEVDKSDSDLGPRISIHDKSGKELDFPHPLLYTGKLHEIDHVAAVIESSIISIVLCAAEGTIKPLAAYGRLRELGGTEDALSEEIEHLIKNGREVSDGSDEFAVAQRREKVLDWIDRVIGDFDMSLGKSVASKGVYEYPVVWEIRDDIHSALRALRSLVADVTAETDTVYSPAL